MFLLRNLARSTAALALAALFAASAQAASVDYVGFAWETGGIAASEPGDQLAAATVITGIDPLFEVDLAANEATLYIEGLVSGGASVDPVTGATVIAYTGGTIAIYASPVRDHDWGTYPANGTVPATFVDGDLVFAGEFTAFTVRLLPSGMGIFEGYIDGTGGSAVAGPCTNCAYTFAGTFTDAVNAQIPEGYDLQVDGVLEVESAIDTRDTSWGTFKQLYNQAR